MRLRVRLRQRRLSFKEMFQGNPFFQHSHPVPSAQSFVADLRWGDEDALVSRSVGVNAGNRARVTLSLTTQSELLIRHLHFLTLYVHFK